jgi:putative copper export protein
MLGVVVVVAFTRSASGHAADAGDFRLPELMDWVHLVAASFWGGGLIVLFTVVLPIAIKRADDGRILVANIARRFSTLAGATLAGVLLTGMYNTWFELRSFQALWETPYGQTLIAKLLLLLVLIMLGASNRYISVPLLEQWAGRPLTKLGTIRNSLVARYLTFIQREPDGTRAAYRFVRKVGIEAILIVGILVCAALLQHEVPARHFLHLGPGHVMEKSKIEEKKTSALKGVD